MDDAARYHRLAHAVRLAIARLRPFAEVHPYVASTIAALAATLDDLDDV